MATFRYSDGILTEEWSMTGGFGGVPGWSCRGICLDTVAAQFALEKDQLTRYRFEEIPFRRALDVICLDGTPVIIYDWIDVRGGPITATNTGPAQYVYRVVKLGPVRYANYAPAQDSGPFSGRALFQFQVDFQTLGR